MAPELAQKDGPNTARPRLRRNIGVRIQISLPLLIPVLGLLALSGLLLEQKRAAVPREGAEIKAALGTVRDRLTLQAAQLEIDRRNRVRHGCGDTRYVADPCREALAATSNAIPIP